MIEHSYIYVGTIISMILLIILLVVLFFIYSIFYTKKLRENNVYNSTEYKLYKINHYLKPLGYAYDSRHDILTSFIHPSQRHFSFSAEYDEAAPVINMVLQHETIPFFYNDRYWRLELWKGQYGIKSGAEIGLSSSDSSDGPFLKCTAPAQQLQMKAGLYKAHELLFEQDALHWWLAGFIPGMYSQPGELKLKVQLTFPSAAMTEAFVQGLEDCGYHEQDYYVHENTVFFDFNAPRHFISETLNETPVEWIQTNNRRLCDVYHSITFEEILPIDKLLFILENFQTFPIY